MDVIGVDDKCSGSGIGIEFAHAVEIDQKGEEDFVGGGTVLENTEKISFEGDGGDVSSMEGEGGCRGRYGGAGGGCEGEPKGRIVVRMDGCGIGCGCDAVGAHPELVVGGCDLGKQRGKQSDQVRRRV